MTPTSPFLSDFFGGAANLVNFFCRREIEVYSAFSFKRVAIFSYLVYGVLLANSILVLFSILYYSRYGIDFTDEGYYFLWISNPSYYAFSHPVTFFGNVYSCLYKFFNGDIGYIRQANILIIFLLAFFSSFLILRWCSAGRNEKPYAIISMAAALASLSLVYFSAGLLTPSYNSLCFQGLFIVSIGIVFLSNGSGKNKFFGSLLLGFGGCIVFLAKPSSAAAIAFLSLLYFFRTRAVSLRLLIISGVFACFFVLISALLIDGSLSGFIHRFELGFDNQKIIGAGHDLGAIFRFDKYDFNRREYLTMLALSVIALAGNFLSVARRVGVIVFFVYLFFLLSIGVTLYGWGRDFNISSLVFIVVPFVLFFCAIFFRAKQLAANVQINKIAWFCLFIFLVPAAYSFGTNNNYLVQSSLVCVFWVLSGVVFAYSRDDSIGLLHFIPVVLLMQLVALVLIDRSIENPYRQPYSLRLNNAEYKLRGGGTIILPKEYSRYLEDLNVIAAKAGFAFGQPVIDLSGNSPGVLYALGANVVGQPWINGGYLGSDRLAIASFNSTSCEDLAKAWVLEEPNGAMRLSAGVLDAFGASRETDFEVLGSVVTPANTGGYKVSKVQNLLKPTRDFNTALKACRFARKSVER